MWPCKPPGLRKRSRRPLGSTPGPPGVGAAQPCAQPLSSWCNRLGARCSAPTAKLNDAGMKPLARGCDAVVPPSPSPTPVPPKGEGAPVEETRTRPACHNPTHHARAGAHRRTHHDATEASRCPSVTASRLTRPRLAWTSSAHVSSSDGRARFAGRASTACSPRGSCAVSRRLLCAWGVVHERGRFIGRHTAPSSSLLVLTLAVSRRRL